MSPTSLARFRNARRVVAVSMAVVAATAPAFAGRTEIKFQTVSRPLYELPRKNLYGLGLSEDGGLITIANGTIHIARLNPPEKSPPIELDESIDNMKTVSKNVIYANVALWSEIPLSAEGPNGVTDLASLNSLINSTLRKLGYENPGTVPFLVKGTFKTVRYHLNRPESGPAIAFEKNNGEALLVGFFTKTVGADLAKPELKSMAHVLLSSDKRSGIVDEIELKHTVKNKKTNSLALFLPR